MARGKSGGAVRIDLLAKTATYTRNMSDARKRIVMFQRTVENANRVMSRAFKFVTIALTGFTAAVVIGVKRMVQYSSRLIETSRAAGLTTRSLRDIRALLEGDGLSVERSTKAMLEFNKRIGEAHQGFGTANRAIKSMGISLTDQQGNLKTNEDLFYEVANQLRSMENQSKAASLAYDLLGRDGKEIVGTFRNVEGSLRDASREMGKYRTLTDEQLEANKALGQAQTDFNNTFSDLLNRILAPLAPVLTDLLESWTQWLVDLRDTPGALEDMTAPLLTVANAIKDISDSFTTIGNAWDTMKSIPDAFPWGDNHQKLAQSATDTGITGNDILNDPEILSTFGGAQIALMRSAINGEIQKQWSRYQDLKALYENFNPGSSIPFDDTKQAKSVLHQHGSYVKLETLLRDELIKRGTIKVDPIPVIELKPIEIKANIPKFPNPIAPSSGMDYSILSRTHLFNMLQGVIPLPPSSVAGGQDWASRLLRQRTGTGATVPFDTPISPTRGYNGGFVSRTLESLEPVVTEVLPGMITFANNLQESMNKAPRYTSIKQSDMNWAAKLLGQRAGTGATVPFDTPISPTRGYDGGFVATMLKEMEPVVTKIMPGMMDWSARTLTERLKMLPPSEARSGEVDAMLKKTYTEITPLMIAWAGETLARRLQKTNSTNMAGGVGFDPRNSQINEYLYQRGQEDAAFRNAVDMMKKGREAVIQSDFLKGLDDAKKKTNELRSSFESLGISIFENFSNAGDALKKFARQLLNIGFQRTILNPIATSLWGAADGSSSGILGGWFNSIFPAGANADGGFARGGLGIVGERGPEVVDFSQPGRVYTTEQLGAALGAGSGVNITYNIQSTDGPGVRAALAHATPGIVNAAQAQITDNANRFGSTRRMIRGTA